MRKWIILMIALVVLAGAGYTAWVVIQNNQRAQTIKNLQTEAVTRGNLVAMVGATGQVRPNQSASLSWQTSGIVATVNIEESDQVTKDQSLATLEQTSLSQSIILAESDLLNAQKSLEDLQQSTLAQVQAQQAISTTQQAVIEAERALDQYDEDTYEDDLDKARQDMVDAENDLEDAQDEFDKYQDWDEDNETRKDAKQAMDDAQQKYDENRRIYDLLVIEKAQAENALAVALAQLDDAQREYERLKDGPDPRDVQILEARIAAAEATLSLARLEAPFAGTVTLTDVKPGDQATPGKVAFRLDDLSRLLVDVRISEVDINRVRVDQQVQLSFDAIQGKEYTGVVSEVSNVGVINQGVVEFEVTIELTDADEDVKPGMTAAVNIVVEQLNDVLVVPNRAVRVVNGQRVVYVLENSELVMVNITLGSSSDTVSEVVSGDIQVGEALVLNPPVVFDTNGPPPFVRGR